VTKRRVVITGMGAVCPAGVGVTKLWEATSAGKPMGGRIRKLDPSRNHSRIAAMIPEIDLGFYHVTPEELGDWDPLIGYAVVAAGEAMRQADLQGTSLDRCGVCVGTAIGGVEAMERRFATLVVPEEDQGILPRYPALGGGDVAPSVLWSYSPNTPSVEIAARWGIRGPVTCVSTGCTAGVDAIGYGLDAIRSGDVDWMVAGGADAPVTPICLSAFDVIRALTRRNDDPTGASRPFDSRRDGFLLAEGAGVVVLEELEHARTRNVPILAEICGFGTNCNAFHMTSMHENGEMLAASILLALEDAGLEPGRIDYINAHGSSTPQNDRAETAAYKTIFGPRAYDIPISSTKSVTGHPLGASSAMEVIISTRALQESWVPPTANLVNPSADCDLDYTPREGRRKTLRYVLSNASGFGGLHSAIVIGRGKS